MEKVTMSDSTSLWSSSEDSLSDDAEETRLYHGVYVSADNHQITDITLTLEEVPTLLGCKEVDYRSVDITRIRQGEPHTYSLIIFCDDRAQHKNLPLNHEASALAGTDIYGPVVIVDEYVELTQAHLL